MRIKARRRKIKGGGGTNRWKVHGGSVREKQTAQVDAHLSAHCEPYTAELLVVFVGPGSK